MFFRLVLPFLMTLSVVAWGNSPSNSNQLGPEDQAIYLSTFEKCKPGNVRAAARVAFDLDNVARGVQNWLQITSGNIMAIEARARSRGMTESIAKLRNSPGFWLAMTDCFGYRYGEANYGNLMKQIVDLGHLTTEFSAAALGAGTMLTGARFALIALQNYPIATRFIVVSLLTIHLGNTVNQLIALYSSELTPEQERNLSQIRSQIFSEPDKAIQGVLREANVAIARIDEQLREPALPQDKRNALLEKRNRIIQGIQSIKNLQS